MDFCLIFVPFGHYDEPEILPYENPSMCPMGADVRHGRDTAIIERRKMIKTLTIQKRRLNHQRQAA